MVPLNLLFRSRVSHGLRHVSSSAAAAPSLAKLVDSEGLTGGLELIGVLQQVGSWKGDVRCDDVKAGVAVNGARSQAPVVNGIERTAGGAREVLVEKYEQQLELEQRSLYDALEKYQVQVKSAKQRDMIAAMPRAKKLLVGWFGPLVEEIKSEQERVGEEWTYDLDWAVWSAPSEGEGAGSKIIASNQTRAKLAPYFVLLEPEEMAVLTMHVAIGRLIHGDVRGEGGRAKVASVALQVGKAIEDQVTLLRLRNESQKRNSRMNKLKKAISLYGGTVDANLSILEEFDINRELQPWEVKMAKDAIKLQQKLRIYRNKWTQKGVNRKSVRSASQEKPWDADVVAQLGAKLLGAFIRVATVEVKGKKVPAIHHEIVWKRGRAHPMKEGALTVHPAVVRSVEDSSLHPSIALDRALPMVCPPKDWTGCRCGGYFSLVSTIMRVKGNEEQLDLLHKAETTGEMSQIYKALNVLGNTPWRINKEVLSVVEAVWEGGGGTLDIPPRQDLKSPDIVQDRFKVFSRFGGLQATYAGESAMEMLVRKRAIKKVMKKNRELFSMRSDFALKLGVAQRFKDEDKIYFPHNMDFRGRAYPIPPHLNHLGADVSRGILQFAESLPLGQDGFGWLLIQVANLYGGGADKLPMPDRKIFGEQHLDDILDSAKKPLDGKKWWMGADEPWQLLATCKEIRNALNWGAIETFPSRMHVHQDGSCNGLQHYAALGRDFNGGMAVNLLPADKPQDVYTGIAKIVSKKVEEDASEGHEVALKLKGHVDRKLVKQTVMTSVYGVTFVGAREQIGNRLKERGWDDDTTIFKVSAYAARVTLEGLQEGFTNAKDIMQWLADCAHEIAKNGKTVVWKTPLGLPVVQPYRKADTHSVKTVLQQLNLRKQDMSSPVMRQRQKSAFPPNYVHSLDSTHMMMTAIDCSAAGLAFAGVHDSFWTHAGSVDRMNDVLRNNFYKLHSKPLLQQLRDDFQRMCPKAKFPKVPELGNLDLSKIHESTYFFS